MRQDPAQEIVGRVTRSSKGNVARKKMVDRNSVKSAYLVVCQSEAELLHARLDSIPTSQPMSDRDISCQSKVFWLENLVRRGVVQDCLCVNTGLVCECAISAVCKLR